MILGVNITPFSDYVSNKKKGTNYKHEIDTAVFAEVFFCFQHLLAVAQSKQVPFVDI